ncbi:DUF4398 domain-containing protein [Deferribacter thermophilus]|uniref:LysM peptidoglycan-binding domain-containing protein n=1 Tax=Deferribacter thermophilus TaxID=53573 RepID=UPI003C1C7538
MRYFKIFLLMLITSVLLFACAKPPVKKYSDAQNSIHDALKVDADKCAPKEYDEAKKSFIEAEREMENAKNYVFRKKYYDRAEGKLEEAKIKAEKAKKVALQRKEAINKLEKKLNELRNELDSIKEDGIRYDPDAYSEAEKLYAKARKALDDCKPAELNLLISKLESDINNMKEKIAIAKAEEMKKSLEKEEVAKVEIYTVVKGDCLWKISELKYMNPFMWPLIYWTNKDLIKDPDLIYPGQVFKIKKNFTSEEKYDAINFAKNRGPWSLFDGK